MQQVRAPDWKGCGAHVEQVLGHVPKANRCDCPRDAQGAGLGAALRSFFGLK